jgi:ABC-type sugar transport system ATPase subunit
MMFFKSTPSVPSAVGIRPAIEVQAIEKHFSGIMALGGVSFDVKSGEVHCLCGENGAGKSTLIKIIAGSLKPDAGLILLHGNSVQLTSPQDGLKRGIGVVYQELELIPNLSIMENLSLGREPATAFGTIDWKAVRRNARAVLDLMHVRLDVDRLVSSLTVAQAQLVSIAKVLAMEPEILVLDEPTAALAGGELETLFALIDRLKEKGVAIIYISHRLDEIFRLGDRITVLRDGKAVKTVPITEATEDILIQWMVGRKTESRFPDLPVRPEGGIKLSVKNLTTPTLKDISFEIRAGEILGCTGLAGCGHAALARALVGLEAVRDGEISIDGVRAVHLSPRRSQRLGLSLVPEDRKGQGLVTGASIADNASYSILDEHARFGILNAGAIEALAQHYRMALKIRCATFDQSVSTLSGGNQQKVVLARVLSSNPQVLVLDEPTRGIDVGAKAEIYDLIVNLAGQGRAILLISSEMEEVMALSHRLMVLSEGRHTATFEPPYNDTKILAKALPASEMRSISYDFKQDAVLHGAAQ